MKFSQSISLLALLAPLLVSSVGAAPSNRSTALLARQRGGNGGGNDGGDNGGDQAAQAGAGGDNGGDQAAADAAAGGKDAGAVAAGGDQAAADAAAGKDAGAVAAGGDQAAADQAAADAAAAGGKDAGAVAAGGDQAAADQAAADAAAAGGKDAGAVAAGDNGDDNGDNNGDDNGDDNGGDNGGDNGDDQAAADAAAGKDAGAVAADGGKDAGAVAADGGKDAGAVAADGGKDAGAVAADDADPEKSLTLDPSVIAKGFAQDGQDPPVDGQAASLTSTNNFINFCVGETITDGKQIKGGSCNPCPIGKIPAVENMPSCKFLFPPNNDDSVAANTAFTITMNIQGIKTGTFVNAQKNYFAAPQQLEGGVIVGHTHITVEKLSAIDSTEPLDPQDFEFFKGVNDAAVDGVASAEVEDGLDAGDYRVCSINSSSNHQPVIVPVAQHGSLDDCSYFTIGGGGGKDAGAVAADGGKDAGAVAADGGKDAGAVAADGGKDAGAVAADGDNGGDNNGGDDNGGNNNNRRRFARWAREQ